MKATGGEFSGELNAASGTFRGTIVADGGKIGNMSVASLADTLGVRITPNSGTFKNPTNSSTLSFTYTTSIENIIEVKWGHSATSNITYNINNPQNNTYVYTYNSNDFSNNGIMYLGIRIKDNDGNYYTDRISISAVNDGQDGAPGAPGEDGVVYTYSIESSLGNTINTSNLPSGTVQTEITGHIYKTVGNGEPSEIIPTSWAWYNSIDGAEATQISGVTTQSFNYNLGSWNSVQIYFEATISE